MLALTTARARWFCRLTQFACFRAYSVASRKKHFRESAVAISDILRNSNVDPKKWILYKDANYFVIDKPAGVSTTIDTNTKTLSVQELLPQLKGFSDDVMPLIVHRLPREISGCLLLARNETAKEVARDSIKLRTFWEKTYWAICVGTPPPGRYEGFIRMRLGEDKKTGAQVPRLETEGGELSSSKWTLIMHSPEGGGLNLMKLTSKVGKKMQSRAHLALGLGMPVLGDSLYSSIQQKFALITQGRVKNEKKESERLEWINSTFGEKNDSYLHLHSRMVTFKGETGEVAVCAPLPPHMQKVLDKLGWGNIVALDDIKTEALNPWMIQMNSEDQAIFTQTEQDEEKGYDKQNEDIIIADDKQTDVDNELFSPFDHSEINLVTTGNKNNDHYANTQINDTQIITNDFSTRRRNFPTFVDHWTDEDEVRQQRREQHFLNRERNLGLKEELKESRRRLKVEQTGAHNLIGDSELDFYQNGDSTNRSQDRRKSKNTNIKANKKAQSIAAKYLGSISKVNHILSENNWKSSSSPSQLFSNSKFGKKKISSSSIDSAARLNLFSKLGERQESLRLRDQV